MNQIKVHSLHIITLLILAVFLGSVLIGLLLQTNPWINSLDGYFYELIHKGFRHPLISFLIKPFNYNFLPTELSPGGMPSYYYFMFLGTLLYLGIYKRSLVGWALFCFIFGTIIAYISSAIDWHFAFRNRPFLTFPSDVDSIGKSAWEKLSSFPSGHARETTLYSTLIANFIPKLKWLSIAFVVFIGYSRVYIGAHFPTDILAGIAIGYMTAKVVLIISREMQIIYQTRKGTGHDSKPKQSSKDLKQG